MRAPELEMKTVQRSNVLSSSDPGAALICKPSKDVVGFIKVVDDGDSANQCKLIPVEKKCDFWIGRSLKWYTMTI